MTPTATCTSEPSTGREGGWTDNVIRYDGMASRAELVDSGGTTRYTWDGIRVLKTEDDVGTLKQRQVHGESPSGIPSVGDITVIESSAGNAYVPEADQIGTNWKLLDSSAAVANSYTYDAFGVARSASEAFANPYRFAGKPLDPEPGLYHFIARQYRPELGRFNSRDPLGQRSGGNSHSYADDRPAAVVDPTGMFCCDQCSPEGTIRRCRLIDVKTTPVDANMRAIGKGHTILQQLKIIKGLQSLFDLASSGLQGCAEMVNAIGDWAIGELYDAAVPTPIEGSLAKLWEKLQSHMYMIQVRFSWEECEEEDCWQALWLLKRNNWQRKSDWWKCMVYWYADPVDNRPFPKVPPDSIEGVIWKDNPPSSRQVSRGMAECFQEAIRGLCCK